MMALDPERITELIAFFAARLAMVFPSVVFPPATALTRFVLSELATEDAALVAACWTNFFFLAASFSAAFWAASASFSAALSAAASSRRR